MHITLCKDKYIHCKLQINLCHFVQQDDGYFNHRPGSRLYGGSGATSASNFGKGVVSVVIKYKVDLL